jgi:DNA-3-methyladenine glycosylase
MTGREFYRRDVLEVAPDLVGAALVRTLPDGGEKRLIITETEAYAGANDTACHASKGRTKRSEMLYHDGGTIFVYLCYGMYWMLNIVTGAENEPQGVLIRACEGAAGPGRLTRALDIDGSFNGLDILANPGLRLELPHGKVNITCDKRVGIDYAAPADRDRLWRFIMEKRE